MVFKAAVGMPKISSTPKCCNSNPLPLLFFPFFFKRQKLAHARNCVWLSASVTSNVQHGPRENPAFMQLGAEPEPELSVLRTGTD